MVKYIKYAVIKTRHEYFGTWKPEVYKELSNELAGQIYERYVVKCLVLQRDNFTCVNENCKTPNSPLTLHHTKFRKNNGKWSIKNCVTVCKGCHQHYHKGKGSLTYHGMTYQIHNGDDTTDWKVIKVSAKKIRKANKHLHGVHISWEMMALLMRFLFEVEIDLDMMNDD